MVTLEVLACAHLVSTNVPKSKFCDLSFEVGQDGTYFYTFDDRMDNLAKMEAFLTSHQKEKGKNPEENHRAMLVEADRQGHSQINLPLTCSDTHIESVHLENNCVSQELSHWAKLFYDRNLLPSFIAFMSHNHLSSVAQKLQEALDEVNENPDAEFTFKTRLLGEQVNRFYSLSKQVFDLMITEEETHLQKMQRYSGFFILIKLRQIFALLHSVQLKEETLPGLENLISAYRSLKCLFQISTVTPSSACLFFEVIEDARQLFKKGLNPAAASGQSGERSIATTKNYDDCRGKSDGLHFFRMLRDNWAFRYQIMKSKPQKDQFQEAKEQVQRVPKNTNGYCDHCLELKGVCCYHCDDDIAQEIIQSVRDKKLTEFLIGLLEKDPAMKLKTSAVLLAMETDSLF